MLAGLHQVYEPAHRKQYAYHDDLPNLHTKIEQQQRYDLSAFWKSDLGESTRKAKTVNESESEGYR